MALSAHLPAIRRVVVSACLILGVLPLLTSSVFGQAFYGSIIGTVNDPSTAALHGAAVTLTNLGTDERHQTVTDASGTYQFLNLLPGRYRVDVERLSRALASEALG